jgi:hypothetical protein
MKPNNCYIDKDGFCLEHSSWLCPQNDWEEDLKKHLDAFDEAMKALKKHNHGR